MIQKKKGCYQKYVGTIDIVYLDRALKRGGRAHIEKDALCSVVVLSLSRVRAGVFLLMVATVNTNTFVRTRERERTITEECILFYVRTTPSPQIRANARSRYVYGWYYGGTNELEIFIIKKTFPQNLTEKIRTKRFYLIFPIYVFVYKKSSFSYLIPPHRCEYEDKCSHVFLYRFLSYCKN